MAFDKAVDEFLRVTQDFETLCKEATVQVEQLQDRLSEIDPSKRDVSLAVVLTNPRSMGNGTRSQVILSWSFSAHEFRVISDNLSAKLLDKNEEWSFLELVAYLPKLLSKIETAIRADMPDKEMVLSAARSALEVCGSTPVPEKKVEKKKRDTPSRFDIIE
jgi:hypothetical protein